MKTIITLKADKAVKEHAQKIARELGLSLSAVVNASLKQFIRSRSVYFSALPTMNRELGNLIGKAQNDFQAKKNISSMFSKSEDALDYLHS